MSPGTDGGCVRCGAPAVLAAAVQCHLAGEMLAEARLPLCGACATELTYAAGDWLRRAVEEELRL